MHIHFGRTSLLKHKRIAVAGVVAVLLGAGFGTQLQRTFLVEVARAQTAPNPRQPLVSTVLDSRGGLAAGWVDFGYAPHTIAKGRSVEIDFANYGGLLLAHPEPLDDYGGLLLKYRAPAEFGDFLEIQLQQKSGEALARVPVRASTGVRVEGGFLEVWLPMELMNPRNQPFERIMLFAHSGVAHETVLVDLLGFTAVAQAPARTALFAVDCAAEGHPISPLIYGMAGNDPSLWTAGATARRWGGNPTSRYNWQINASNLASDWFFRNTGDPNASSYDTFLQDDLRHGVKTALTVPMLGWVAKDTTSYSFPVSMFGLQQATDPDVPGAGNGIGRDGKPISPGPATLTSVPSTPASIEEWVRQIRSRDSQRGRSVDEYILDNEPMLWNATHRDVHPDPATYDELLEKTLAYARAIRRADPAAVIAGPAAWGWLEYQYSAKDTALSTTLRLDRRSHGDQPLLAWYLRKIREYEEQTQSKILDVVDVHFYSMAPGVEIGTQGQTDGPTSALRIRSTRSLWDPTYTDESWINEKMRVIPLVRDWIAQNHPGLGISLGEWNFGAETHMSGGLAAAEALGRFGTEGITSAYYWTSPKDRSPAYWAFRAFRNFDGDGAHFLDWSVPVKSDGALTSLFVSRDSTSRHFVAVLLNLDPRSALKARINPSCGAVAAPDGVTYTGGDAGFKKLEVAGSSTGVQAEVEPYSITVLTWVSGVAR